MDVYFKILGIVMAGALAGLFLRERSFRIVLALCCVALCGVLAVEFFRPVRQMVLRLTEMADISPAVFGPVWKAAAIGILTQTASNYCKDAGETSLVGILELSGILGILYVSLPLFSAVLDLLTVLMGG